MLNGRRHAEMEIKARELTDQYPNSGPLWQLLGASLSMQGKDALHALERATALTPDDAGAHNNLGNALARLGRLEAAAASYRRALELMPDFAEAHNNLGNALLDLGRPGEALQSCRRAVELKPDDPQVHDNLGNACFNLGQLEEAASSYRRVLALEPDLAEAHNNLGSVLRSLGQLDDAVASFRRALLLKPNFADAHSNLGIALRLQSRTAEAEASCERALELNPKLAATMAVLAESRADQGHFAEAEALFRRAISAEPQSPEAWAGIARLRKMTLEDAAWLTAAQRIAQQGLPPRKEALLRYAIGKYFDDVRDYEQAFVNYRRANELSKLNRGAHDRHHLTGTVDQIIRRYDRAWLNRARRDSISSARPVFIVGMLRSGTTLAEQILASHPAVQGAGEVAFWNTALAPPKSCALDGEMSSAALRELGHAYLRTLEDFSPAALRVVDKMPTNFLFLGLIHAALPNARIIHMQRDPIDTCLSIYFQHFESALSYANDLEDLAHYYTEYRRVMTHWRSTLPADALLDVPYESLVDDQETWSRNMVNFIGLPWDPRCLDFHLTRRTVITASKWQVRQKMDRSSVARWRNYAPFIGPLQRLLPEIIHE